LDQSPTSDNMVLGDTIGGPYAAQDTNFYWATTPLLAAQPSNGLRIRFWSWLGLAPGTRAFIQMGQLGYPPINWHTIWASDPNQSYGASTTPVWTLQTFELPSWGAYITWIRFGIGQTGGSVSSGWCIDDLVIDGTRDVREGGATGPTMYNNAPATGARNFGPQLTGQTSAPLTVHISNSASTNLGLGTVTASGAQALDFLVNTGGMSAVLAQGASTTFTISFSRATAGGSTGVVTVPMEVLPGYIIPFDINVTGVAHDPQPAMSLEYGGETVADGAFAAVGAAPPPLTFTIRNSGTANLNLTGSPPVVLSGAFGCVPVVSAVPAAGPIAPGGTATFSIDVAPAGAGGWNFQLSIANDDPFRDPYNVTVVGGQPGSGGNENSGDDSEDAACSSGAGNSALGAIVLLALGTMLVGRRRRVFPALLLCLFLAVSAPGLSAALGVTPMPLTSVPPGSTTGPFVMGGFDVTNPDSVGHVLQSLSLTATGSGDDSVAFAEMSLFVDQNANATYEPGVDLRYGPAQPGYPVNNGTVTFLQLEGIAPGATKHFMIVATLSTAGITGPSGSYWTIVSAAAGTGGAVNGVPCVQIQGFWTGGPSAHPLKLEYDVTGSAPPYQ
jgi:hypothetical protein